MTEQLDTESPMLVLGDESIKAPIDFFRIRGTKTILPYTPGKWGNWKDFPIPESRKYPTINPQFELKVTGGTLDKKKDKSWGQVLSGTLDFRPEIESSAYGTDGNYRIGSIKFALEIKLLFVPCNSPNWSDNSEWGQAMDDFIGRKGMTVNDRKYWALMHELDHFSAYADYFEFIYAESKKIESKRFKSIDQCKSSMLDLYHNTKKNFETARVRSAMFDLMTTRPGGLHAKMLYPDACQFEWIDGLRPTAHSELPENAHSIYAAKTK